MAMENTHKNNVLWKYDPIDGLSPIFHLAPGLSSFIFGSIILLDCLLGCWEIMISLLFLSVVLATVFLIKLQLFIKQIIRQKSRYISKRKLLIHESYFKREKCLKFEENHKYLSLVIFLVLNLLTLYSLTGSSFSILDSSCSFLALSCVLRLQNRIYIFDVIVNKSLPEYKKNCCS